MTKSSLSPEEQAILDQSPASSSDSGQGGLSPEEEAILGPGASAPAAPGGAASGANAAPASGMSPEELAILGGAPGDQGDAPVASPESEARQAELEDKGEVSEAEINQIAQATGANPDDVRSAAPVYGLFPEGQDRGAGAYAKRVGGFLDRGITQGLGAFAYKKTQDDATRKALDQLRELGEKRRSKLETAGEIGTGLLAAGTIGSAVRGAVLASKAAGLAEAGIDAAKAAEIAEKGMKGYDLAALFGGGAAGGVATSQEGEEGKGAAEGVAFAGVAGGLFHGVGKLIGRYGKTIGKGAQAAIKDVTGDVQAALDADAPRLQKAEKALDEAIETGVFPKLEAEANDEAQAVASKATPEVTPEAPTDHTPDLAAKSGPSSETEMPQAAPEGGAPIDNVALSPATEAASIGADLRQFASYLEERKLPRPTDVKTPSEAVAAIREVVSREGKDFVMGEFRRFQASKKAIEVMGEKLEQEIPREATALRKAARFAQDGRAVAGQIDERTGARLESWMDEFSKQNNAFTVKMTEEVEAAKPVLDATAKTGLRSLSVDAINHIEQTGDTSFLKPEQQRAFAGLHRFFETQRQRARELGVPIAEINSEKAKVYIPRMMVDLPTAIQRVNAAAERLGLDVRDPVSRETFERLSSTRPKDWVNLQQSIEWLTGEKLLSHIDLGLALKEVNNPSEVEARLVRRASASMARAEDGVPDYLRETDLNKLTAKWMFQTYHHAYFRDSMAELAKQANLLRAAKDYDGLDFVEKLQAHLMGGGQGTIRKGLMNAKVKLQVVAQDVAEHAREAGHPIIAGAASIVAESPEVMNLLMNQVYPNFLGLSPRAILANLTQPWYMTMPELGTTYGAPILFKATMRAALQLGGHLGESALNAVGLRKGETTVVNYLRERGHLPEQAYNRTITTLANNMKAGALYRMTEGAINKATNWTMAAFELSEKMNRLVAVHTAEEVANDLLSPMGKKGAWRFVQQSMSRGYRDEVKAAVSAGDAKRVRELVEGHIIGRTIFNYNQANLSEFGRAMGPVFSTFSKWPASMAGYVYSDFARKNPERAMTETLRKYLMPVGAALYLNGVFDINAQDNPQVAGLLGQKGLASAAPIYSVKDIAEGHLFSPPAVSLAAKGIKALISMDPYEGYKWTDEFLKSYMPGAVFLRLIGTDLPRLQGEAVQGTMMNRMMEQVSPGFNLDDRVKDAIGRSDK